MDPRSNSDQTVPVGQPPQSAADFPAAAGPAPTSEPPIPAIGSAPTAPPPPPPPPDNGTTASQQAATAQQTQAAGPTEAADNDVIEVEWIHKAKEIVAQTHDDPFKQVQQLNQLKADYMQKRYNKTVKLPEA